MILPNKLRRDSNNLLLGQVSKLVGLVKITGDIKYKVKEVIATKKQGN